MREFKSLEIGNPPKGAYSTDPALYQNHYLEQYRIYSSRFDMEMQRLLTREQFFLTLNAAFLSGVILAREKNLLAGNVGLVAVTALALLLSLVWFITMHVADRLKSAQLHVLRSMESELPAKPFLSERYDTSWKKPGALRLGTIRKFIPALFGILYALYFLLLCAR